MQDFSKLIKELQAGNEELENERAKSDAFFLSIGDGAIITDSEARISKVNEMAANMLGYKSSELLGKWYPKVVIALDDDGVPIPIIDRPITRAFLTGKSVHEKCFYKRKDGSVFPVSLTCSPVILDGRPIGAIQVFHDHTSEYEVDKMKSEFISLASHQLRTPLTSIMTTAHLLSEGYIGEMTEEQLGYMDNILYSVNRMHELITTLLNVTRIEAGRMLVSPELTDLKKLIERICQEATHKANEKKIRLTTNLAVDAKVQTDPLLIREIAANLVSNAIKYTPANGKVTVGLTSHKSELHLYVKDTGYGIPDSQKDKIFTKFFRASNIVDHESVGTGLGLYMIKGISDALGGKLWFESKENEGTTFNFSLSLKGSKKIEGTSRLEPTNAI